MGREAPPVDLERWLFPTQESWSLTSSAGKKSMAIISLFPEVAFVRVLVWNTKVPESFDLFKVSQGADVVLMDSIV